MNADRIILIITGRDRPGVLEELAAFLAVRGGAIEDSGASNLHGSFAMLCGVTGTADALRQIRQDLPQLATSNDFHIEAHEPRGHQTSAETFPYRLSATARQRSDVLQRLSHLMRVLGINIQDVSTRLVREPGGNDAPARFEMQLQLSVPRQTPVTMLRQYLQDLCGEIKVEWTLSAL
jgi:glycine cleavage system transcriptional repressor